MSYIPDEKLIYTLNGVAGRGKIVEYKVTYKWSSVTKGWHWIKLPNGKLKSVKETTLRREK